MLHATQHRYWYIAQLYIHLEYYMNTWMYPAKRNDFECQPWSFAYFIFERKLNLTVQLWCGVSSFWRRRRRHCDVSSICCNIFFFFFCFFISSLWSKWKGWMGFYFYCYAKLRFRKRCFVCDDFIKNDFEFYVPRRIRSKNEKILPWKVMNINERIFWRQYRYQSLNCKM